MEPENLAMKAVAAMIYEVFYPRASVTWRGTDVAPHKKMEHFVVAAASSFPHLLRAVMAARACSPAFPPGLSAVKGDILYHGGSPALNLGLIVAMLPPLCSAAVFGTPYEDTRFLRERTFKEDVDALNKTLQCCWRKSKKPAHRAVSEMCINASNAWEYFLALRDVLEAKGLHGDTIFVEEVLGKHDIRERFYCALGDGVAAVAEIHAELLHEYDLRDSPGVLADFLAVALFWRLLEGWVPLFPLYPEGYLHEDLSEHI